jgi:hypothetical protein
MMSHEAVKADRLSDVEPLEVLVCPVMTNCLS